MALYATTVVGRQPGGRPRVYREIRSLEREDFT